MMCLCVCERSRLVSDQHISSTVHHRVTANFQWCDVADESVSGPRFNLNLEYHRPYNEWMLLYWSYCDNLIYIFVVSDFSQHQHYIRFVVDWSLLGAGSTAK